MQNIEKITPVQSRLNDVQLTCGANAIIDLHALSVRANQHFVLSKKYKRLAYNLAKEIASLEPKVLSNLKAC